ncbi:hypothetical protein O0536_25660, partial [Brevibacillus laterosporus]|uniref:hypothetical protein n=1 Tax=Brevibacillus laterosporus TaxID=1465 RepID=UPI0022A6AC21
TGTTVGCGRMEGAFTEGAAEGNRGHAVAGLRASGSGVEKGGGGTWNLRMISRRWPQSWRL